MAEAEADTECVSPWDPLHEEAQREVSDDETLMEFLMTQLPSMTDEMDLSDTFWTLLKEKAVITDQQVSSIQATTSKKLRLLKLAKHLTECRLYQFHGFVWATVNIGQSQALATLGLDINHYFDKDVFFKSSRFHCQSCQETYSVKVYILSTCGHYVCRPCVKGAKFSVNDDKSEDITCPVASCGKVTKTSRTNGGDIGLPDDVEFMMVAGIVEKSLSKSMGDRQVTGQMMEVTMKQLDVVNRTTAILRSHNDQMELHGEELLAYVADTREEAKAKIDQWAEMNTELITTTRQEVSTKLQRASHWAYTMSNIADMLAVGVPLPGDLKCPIIQLSPEAEAFLDKLNQGLPAIDTVSHFPYREVPESGIAFGLMPTAPTAPPLPAGPPSKAKLLAEWRLPDSGGLAPRVAWHPAEHLLVTGASGLYELRFSQWTSQCTHILKHRADKPRDISVGRNGSWVLTLKDSLVSHTVGQAICTQSMSNSCHTAAIHASGFYISDDTARIQSCDSKFVHKTQHIMCRALDYSNKHIRVAQTGDMVVTLPGSNTVCIIDPGTDEYRYIQGKGPGDQRLSIPWDACTTNTGGGHYILVAERNGECVSVYDYGGQFLHELAIEGGAGRPWSISVLDRHAKNSLMAIGRAGLVKIYKLK